MKDFDVVVIGAGLGGLTAACRLAKEGRRVLVLERHNVPGGYASSFIRGRFEFEISLHELSGLGDEKNRGPIWRLLEEYGVTDKVDFIPIPDFYRSVFPDLDITVPVGREDFEAALCDAFPRDAEGIRRFSDTMFRYAEQALRANRMGPQAVMQAPEEFPVLLEHMNHSLADVLNAQVEDPRARAVLGQIWGYFCQPPSRMAFTIYALGVASYLRFGPAHIKGKSQALSQALMDAVEGLGGEVWLNNGAAHILTSGGAVKGVRAEDGTEVSCPVVVANANPAVTCLELLGRDQVPDWYLRRLGAWSGGASTLNVYLGLDAACGELGLTNHENFVNSGYDLDAQFYKMLEGFKHDPDGAAVTAYNVVDPDFSPPGTSSVVITLIAYADPWLRLSPYEYERMKGEMAEKMVKLAERIAPDLRSHIEEMEVATPLTNMRFTRNLGGSIIGFDQTFQGSGLVRMPARGPLDGLYFAGAWVNIGGGYEPSLYSGYLTAGEVLEDLERGGRDAAAAGKLRERLESEAGEAAPLGEQTAEEIRKPERLHPRRLRLRVEEVIRETSSACSFRLSAESGELPLFRAGQYVNLFVEVDGVKTSRPYSIASAPGEPHYLLTVRRVEGGFVSTWLLENLRAGMVLEATAPAGSFVHEPLRDGRNLVFLAGGSGVTPFRSIILDAVNERKEISVHLVYGSRDPSDVIFREELEGLAREHPWLRVDLVISEPPPGWEGRCGMLDAATLRELVGDVRGKTFYVCGPNPMYPFCQGALRELGVPDRLVRREVYGPAQDVTTEPDWPGGDPGRVFRVREERSGREFEALAGRPLLDSLEGAGLESNPVCRAGECTYCRTRLVEGEVWSPQRVRARWADNRFGFIHPCMSYPRSDLVIRL